MRFSIPAHALLFTTLVVGCADDGATAPTDAGTDAPADTPDAAADTAPDLVRDAQLDGAPTPIACFPLCDRQWGTAHDDEAIRVAFASDGALLIAGYEGGTLEGSAQPSGDATGVVERWVRTGPGYRFELDTPGSDAIDAIAAQAGGHVLFAGRTTGTMPGQTARGSYDLVVGELDADGDLAAYTQDGARAPEHPVRIDATRDAIVVAGYDDAFFPPDGAATWADPFVRIQPRGLAPGQPIWRRFGTPGEDHVRALALDPRDGSIFVGGRAFEAPRPGAFVTKLDARGAEAWTHVLGRFSFQEITAVLLHPGGDLILVGSTLTRGTDPPLGGQDAVVMRFDPRTREPVWETRFGTGESDRAVDATLDARGRIHVVGSTSGAFIGAGPNRGGDDLFAAVLHADAGLLRVVQRGSAGDERPTSIAVAPSGDVVVAGSTDGALVPAARDPRGGPWSRPAGRFDAFLLVFPALD